MMHIPVLVEPVNGTGFRASGPFSLTADGETIDDALSKLEEIIRTRIRNGATIHEIDVGPVAHPLLRMAGMWKPDDPMIEEWRKAVSEYRRQVDEDADAL